MRRRAAPAARVRRFGRRAVSWRLGLRHRCQFVGQQTIQGGVHGTILGLRQRDRYDAPTTHVSRNSPTSAIGTVTLLFTDIEGSTRLLQRLGSEDYSRVLGDHHRIVRGALNASQGTEVKTEGDSFFAVFGSAQDAIVAAVRIQRELAAQAWPAGSTVAVRMGIHTGDVGQSGTEYVGIDIHRAARIAAAANGGQVLLSSTTKALVGR